MTHTYRVLQRLFGRIYQCDACGFVWYDFLVRSEEFDPSDSMLGKYLFCALQELCSPSSCVGAVQWMY